MESTTEGSILLAGIYLKVGVIGWMRYVAASSPTLLLYTLPLVLTTLVAGTVALLVVVLTTIDIKRFAAVSSILHLQLVLVMLLHTPHTLLVLGAVLQLTTHSYIAAMLFLVVGDVYEALGSRCSKHHHYTTRVSTVLLVLLLANSGYPCSASFHAE